MAGERNDNPMYFAQARAENNFVDRRDASKRRVECTDLHNNSFVVPQRRL